MADVPGTADRVAVARADHRLILELVAEGSSVLDLGCGRGELLAALAAARQVRGQGVEIDRHAIGECVRAGISVLYGDLDEGLNGYRDGSFDYVILNNCLAELDCPEKVLAEALRVGRAVVVGFENASLFGTRLRLLLRGRAPAGRGGCAPWYSGPVRRCLGVADFRDFCRARAVRVLVARFLRAGRPVFFWPNLRADYALFLVAKPQPGLSPEETAAASPPAFLRAGGAARGLSVPHSSGAGSGDRPAAGAAVPGAAGDGQSRVIEPGRCS